MNYGIPLALLNTTSALIDGTYEVKTISLQDAQQILEHAEQSQQEILSAIGHESTAEIMTTLLKPPSGIPIKMNRIQFEQQLGQVALVFKLNDRPPEGKILNTKEIQEIGYSFKVMTRTA